jgi:hypothetical protein
VLPHRRCARPKLLWQKLAGIEKAFLIVLLLDLILALAVPASGLHLFACYRTAAVRS